ncbi:MAG: hypothetical protein R3F62_00225 [Planctomycetota bacterium]
MAERGRLARLVLGEPLARASSAGWVYPLPPLTRLTRALRVAVGLGGVLAGILCLGLAVLWGVPACAAATSADYARVQERAAANRELSTYVGTPLRCERVPTHYRFTEDGASFRFWVEGPRGRAEVSATVQAGQVSRFALLRVRFG